LVVLSGFEPLYSFLWGKRS